MVKRSRKKKRKLKNSVKLVLILVLLLIVFITFKAHGQVYNRIQEKNELPYTEKSLFPTEVYGVPVYTQLISEDKEIRPGVLRKIKYIVIHETDNTTAGVGAANHAAYLSNNNDNYTSWHYTVDDKEIYHHLPDNEVGYHAGEQDGNLYGIGIELCVNSDGDFDKTFENAAKLVAYLIENYELDIDAIKTHNDFNGKDCPHIILKTNRMDEFKDKVREYLGG